MWHAGHLSLHRPARSAYAHAVGRDRFAGHGREQQLMSGGPLAIDSTGRSIERVRPVIGPVRVSPFTPSTRSRCPISTEYAAHQHVETRAAAPAEIAAAKHTVQITTDVR